MQISGDDKLLVVQPLVGIGDMVWHKPWIDQLIATNDVVLAVKKSSRAQDLFRGQLSEKDFIWIERKIRGKKGRHDGVLGQWRLAQQFRQTGAKRALILHHSQSYHRAAKLAGIKTIAGFGYGEGKSSAVMLEPSDKSIHSLEKLPKFWALNGWPAPQQGWHIPIEKQDQGSAAAWLDEQNIPPHQFLVLGVGAMHPERIWPAERFAALIALIQQQRPDLTPVIMGGPDEKPIADDIQNRLDDHKAKEVFLPFKEAMAVLSMAGGYVGNDTSLLNIAGVLGVPSLGLFSQSPPLTYVKDLHHLDVIPQGDYGKDGVILNYAVDDVLAWVIAHL